MRPDRRKLIRKALEHHAPMSDAQLCRLMGHFGLKPATTRGIRYRMMKAKEVRRVENRVYRTRRGHAVNMWELAPRKHEGETMKPDAAFFAVARIDPLQIVYSGFKIEDAAKALVAGTVSGTGSTLAEAEANAHAKAVEVRRAG